MKNIAYPLKFHPILKERIWGGNRLKSLLNKKTNSNNIGESWEISDVEGNSSVIINGPYKGRTLKEILVKMGPNLIGHKNFTLFKNQFPLLIKFIDAKQDLSIQLHPNDEIAKARHNSFGKTEMWYVMKADDDANLIVDFNQPMNKQEYLKHLKNKTLPEVLNFEKVKEGDTYFIEVGRVHAIGAGVLLAEIQQTSDVTYRIYDWDRVDEKGNFRELHTDLAMDAIDFNMPDNYKVNYSMQINETNKMVNCPYFKTNFLRLTEKMNKVNNFDSFIVYICVDGEAHIQTEYFSESISKGETVLIPASIKNFTIDTNSSKLLEVYV